MLESVSTASRKNLESERDNRLVNLGGTRFDWLNGGKVTPRSNELEKVDPEVRQILGSFAIANEITSTEQSGTAPRGEDRSQPSTNAESQFLVSSFEPFSTSGAEELAATGSEPLRDAQKRISGHKSPITGKQTIFAKYVGDSNILDSLEFVGGISIRRQKDGSYLMDRYDGSKEKLASLQIDQNTGDITYKTTQGDSMIYSPSGLSRHLDQKGEVDTKTLPNGDVFAKDATGLLKRLDSERSAALAFESSYSGLVDKSKPHKVETKSNGDVVSHFDDYRVTEKSDKSRVTEWIATGTKLTELPDGTRKKEFVFTDIRNIASITTTPDGKTIIKFTEKGGPNGAAKLTEYTKPSFKRISEFPKDSYLTRLTEFDKDDPLKRVKVKEFQDKTVTDFRKGAAARSITEYTKGREDGVVRVTTRADGTKDIEFKDGKTRTDGKPVTKEVRNGENGLKRVTEREWENFDTKGSPLYEPDKIIDSEFEGNKDGITRITEFKGEAGLVRNDGASVDTNKIIEYRGRKDGLQQQIEGRASGISDYSWNFRHRYFTDRTVTETWQGNAEQPDYTDIVYKSKRPDHIVRETLFKDSGHRFVYLEDGSLKIYKNGKLENE